MRDWILIGLLALIAGEGAFLVIHQLETPRWAYGIMHAPDPVLETELAEAGRNGWEIVAARRAVVEKDVTSYELIMKRRVRDGEPTTLVPFLAGVGVNRK